MSILSSWGAMCPLQVISSPEGAADVANGDPLVDYVIFIEPVRRSTTLNAILFLVASTRASP